ncbi:MAG: ribosome biogenesis GTPase Der [Hyphomicrobiales bacterium]|nr:ribosome biogenesis GTPase Der [Hyphomicrobiales bacterium]
MYPSVVIIGRPNVGKSTLFNRLAGKRMAIVDDSPGVTRDRREATAQLGDLSFTIMDTAGYETADGENLPARIQAQTARAVEIADIVLMLVDARAGLVPMDHELAQVLRRSHVPVIVVANKYDSGAGEAGRLEAFGLGLGEPVPISAVQGEGMALLYDSLKPFMEEMDGRSVSDAGPAAEGEKATQLAIIGRPNVGKSTLLNRLLGEERVITGPEAGITRDAIAINWTYQDRPMRIIDTAGLRRRSKVDAKVEALSVNDTRRAIRFAHVCAVVIDGPRGVDKQDLSIASWVAEEGRAALIAVNKCDAIRSRHAVLADIRQRIETSLPQIRGVPLVTVSAKTGQGFGTFMPAVLAAYEVWNKHVPTAALNRWLADVIERHKLPNVDGRPLKIRYMTQVSARPPTFALFLNRKVQVPETYLRYLANALRDSFAFTGVPIRFVNRTSDNPYAKSRANG